MGSTKRTFSGIFKPREEVPNPQYVLLGAPYDGSSSFRPGARLAPPKIREMAESLNACTERGLDLSGVPVVDEGDLALGRTGRLPWPKLSRRWAEC